MITDKDYIKEIVFNHLGWKPRSITPFHHSFNGSGDVSSISELNAKLNGNVFFGSITLDLTNILSATKQFTDIEVLLGSEIIARLRSCTPVGDIIKHTYVNENVMFDSIGLADTSATDEYSFGGQLIGFILSK